MLQEFVEEIRKTVNEECMGLHTALPAKVEAVRAGRVDARPYGKYRTSTGQLLDWPVIPSVPVYMYQSGQAAVGLPVRAGDDCLLIIADCELDSWLHGQAGQVANISLRHSLSNAVALPGLAKNNQLALEAAASGSVVVVSGGTKLAIGPAGVSIQGNLTVSGNITAGGTISPR